MLNPIENAFSKVKACVKSALSVDNSLSLGTSMEDAAGRIAPADSAGYFRYVQRNITNCAVRIPYNQQ
ncbi:hypothetical protein BDAP_000090 [Binucleata daphniae]